MRTKFCNIKNCHELTVTRGWCSKHYKRWLKYGDPAHTLRRENGLGTVGKNGRTYLYKPQHPNAHKNGRILAHIFIMSEHIGRPLSKDENVIHIDGDVRNNKIDNLKIVLKNEICTIKNCTNKCKYDNKYCSKHWRRVKSTGDPLITKRAEAGAGTITKYGYKKIWKPNHPNSNPHGTILEHRYVMSKILGRPLRPNENVHHKNGNRLDNRPDNLELWVKRQCPGQRLIDLIDWAKYILATYEGEYEKITK